MYLLSMGKKNEIKVMVSDYMKIRELSQRIDCTVTNDDFNTSHPNPYRISYLVSDIGRYLKCGGALS